MNGPASTPLVISARIAAFLGFLVLTVIAIVHYAHDERERDPVYAYMRRFKVELRRPLHARTIDYAPSADVAAEVAADVALQDAVTGVQLSDIAPATQQVWLEVIGDLNSELRSARGLLVAAVRQRPAWPYHKALLGEIEYTRARRAVALGANAQLWLAPMQSAMAAAPGDRSIATFAGSALSEAWPFLGDRERAKAPAVFEAALHDPAFVSSEYLNLIDSLGHPAVIGMLPEESAPLRAAIAAESEVADVEEAAQLSKRWERAEKKERANDLAAIEERAGLNDLTGQTRACHAWASRHSVFDFDDDRGRREAGRVLELWPDDPGNWSSDERSEFVRYFLDRKGEGVDAHAVYRAAQALIGTPLPLFARAALLAGDSYSAESVARRADTAGAFEWTPFFVDLAYARLKAGRVDDAAAALAEVSPNAQGECGVEVARAAIAAAGKRSPLTPDDAEILTSYPPAYWSKTQLPICIDPGARQRNLVVDVEVKDYPALISYGFDQARTATQFLPAGRVRLTVPLGNRVGRHIFAYQMIAGSAVEPSGATIE